MTPTPAPPPVAPEAVPLPPHIDTALAQDETFVLNLVRALEILRAAKAQKLAA